MSWDNSIEFFDGLGSQELVDEIHQRQDALVMILHEVEVTRDAAEAASAAVLQRFAARETEASLARETDVDPLAEQLSVRAARMRARLERARLERAAGVRERLRLVDG